MSWRTLEVNNVVEDGPWVKIGCTNRNGGYPQMKLALSPACLSYLWVDEGRQVQLHLGSGDHAGWLSVTAGSPGLTLTAKNQQAGSLAVKFSGRHLGVREKHATTRLDGECVVLGRLAGAPVVSIELPAWLNSINEGVTR